MDRNHSVLPAAEADASLMQALDGYLAAVEAGTAPHEEEFLARYPHLASELRECLASLAFIRRASPGVPSLADAPGQEGETTSGCLGDFRIVREVGRGGMGVVYEAEQISLGRRVALKVLPFAATMDPRQLQRFHNEARSVACLHHEHIVPIYAVGCERGVHFYAMQFINGRTLAQLIGHQHSRDEPTAAFQLASPDADTAAIAAARTGQAPRDAAYFRRVAEWGIQAAEALEHAHSVGIVHRDVKPGNLMIDAQGKLWVTDFGLARTAADVGLTMTGDMLGTLRYMSPEQALAKHGLVDHRSDVYALGVTLYEVLTGRPAIEGADSHEILNNIAMAEPRSPRKLNPAVPIDLETVILKALAKEPSERYGSAREFADDLSRVRDDHAILARRPSMGQRLVKLLRRNRRAAGFAAGAVALVVIALASSALYATAAYQAENAQRQDAELAATNERDQRRSAEVALAAAAKQRRFARQAVNEMYTEVAENLLSQLPGMGEVRKRFLQKALAYYEQFADEDSKEPEAQVEIIRANMRVGRIQWLMQQNEGADAAYGRAFARAEALAADTPPKREYQELLAQACFQRSFVSLSLRKKDDALSLRRRSLQLYQQLASEHPEVAEYRRAGVHVCSRMAALMHHLGRLPEAEEIGRTALVRAEKLLADFPGEPDFRTELGFACLDLGTVLVSLHRDADAQPILCRALEVWEDVARGNPRAEEHQAHAARSAYSLGSLYARIGEKSEARQYYQKAFVHFRKLVVEHPEVPAYQSEVFQVASSIVNSSPSKKDRYEVIQGLDELLGCRDIQSAKLVKRVFYLVNDCAGKASQDPGLGLDERLAERKQYMVHAESIRSAYQAKLEEAIRLRPTDPEPHYNLGVILHDKNQLDDAIAEFQETILLKKDYPNAHHYLGYVLAAKSRAKASMRLFASAARLYQQAFASNPSLADPWSENRYNAACAAALAGCGQGEEAAKLDPAERGRWRGQAFDWLRADLTRYTTKLPEGEDIHRRVYARRNLQQWQRTSALEGVRGPAGPAELPEAERAEWRRFWTEVKAAAEAPPQQQKLPKPEVPAPGK